MLKFSPKTRQNNDYAMYKHMGIGIVSTNVYDRQPVWLQGMLPTANNGCTMQTQKQSVSYSWFSTSR